VLLIWDGKQASCSTDANATKMSSDESTAYSEGKSAADSASSAASGLGFGSGVPIFYDMEAFDYHNSTCLHAAKKYMDGWDDELVPTPFIGAMYGSACGTDMTDFAGITDPPVDAFLADWNGTYDVFSVGCVPDSDWNSHQRVHQFLGGVSRTYGGLTLNPIDLDCARTYLAAKQAYGTDCNY